MGGVMSSIVVSGDTSGAITIAAPAVAGTNTLTLPANTGTVLTTASTFAGTGPAFSAYAGAATSLANGTWTKVAFNTEEFDTNNNFASNTFTPTVAGYYQLTSLVSFASSQSTEAAIQIYKNGGQFKTLQDMKMTNLYSFGGSALVYANGTTDYFDVYVYQSSGGSVNTSTGASYVYFQGFLARAA